MEENPLHSKDIQFGVPEKFHKMFNEILLDQNNAGEHDDIKNKSFVELNQSHQQNKFQEEYEKHLAKKNE